MSGTGTGLQLALLSAALMGFRHGFDYDHIAAITDITSVQVNPRRAMRLGLLYALGHAATVAVLGSLVVFFRLSLPHGIDNIAERLVGVTLVVLGIYVLGSLIKGRKVPRSRVAILINSLRWFYWKVRGHWHPHIPKPESSSWNYDAKSVFGIGVIHGLGAETPSQLFVFFLAADLGGIGKGVHHALLRALGMVALENRIDEGAVDRTAFCLQEPGKLFAPLFERRRAIARPYKRVEREPCNTLGMLLREQEADPTKACRPEERASQDLSKSSVEGRDRMSAAIQVICFRRSHSKIREKVLAATQKQGDL